MEPPVPQPADSADSADATLAARTKPRTESMSQRSDNSQTAAEYVLCHRPQGTDPSNSPSSFIRDQMQLEADAREALPYVRSDRPIITLNHRSS